MNTGGFFRKPLICCHWINPKFQNNNWNRRLSNECNKPPSFFDTHSGSFPQRGNKNNQTHCSFHARLPSVSFFLFLQGLMHETRARQVSVQNVCAILWLRQLAWSFCYAILIRYLIQVVLDIHQLWGEQIYQMLCKVQLFMNDGQVENPRNTQTRKADG